MTRNNNLVAFLSQLLLIVGLSARSLYIIIEYNGCDNKQEIVRTNYAFLVAFAIALAILVRGFAKK